MGTPGAVGRQRNTYTAEPYTIYKHVCDISKRFPRGFESSFNVEKTREFQIHSRDSARHHLYNGVYYNARRRDS